MIEIISIGSLTLDLFFQDKSLTISKKRFFLAIGGKYVVNYFNQAIGGGGGNVAVGLARAGIKSSLWTEIGKGGVSQLIIAKLKDENVEIKDLVERSDFTNVSAILLSGDGERTIINHRSHESELEFDNLHKSLFKGAKAVYLGNMPELELELRESILEYAKKENLTTYLNLGVKDCRKRQSKLKKLLSSVDYLLVNRYELSDILDIPPNEIMPSAVNYQSRIFNSSSAVLVVTDGEFGSYAQTKNEIFFQKAVKVKKVIDATGAGDAFTSGFMAARFYGLDLSTSLQSGARNSASIIQKVNAQEGLLNKEELFSR